MNAEAFSGKTIELDVVFLTHDAGGRRAMVQTFKTGEYRPHLRISGVGEFLGVRFVDGPSEILAGRQLRASVSLMYQGVDYSGLTDGTLCTVVEGVKVVAFACVVRGVPTTDSSKQLS
jgi:hypothetical protein